MIRFFKVIILIIDILSTIFSGMFAILGLYEQIVGAADLERLLEKLHIPLSYNQVLIIGVVSIILMYVSYILRKKLVV